MKSVWEALVEVYGLFVEDGSLAVSALAWVLVAGLLLPRLAGVSAWRGPVLFLGIVALLLHNVWRAAFNARRRVLRTESGSE